MGSPLRSFKKSKKSRRLGEVEVVRPDDLAVRRVKKRHVILAELERVFDWPPSNIVPLASAHSVVRE